MNSSRGLPAIWRYKNRFILQRNGNAGLLLLVNIISTWWPLWVFHRRKAEGKFSCHSMHSSWNEVEFYLVTVEEVVAGPPTPVTVHV